MSSVEQNHPESTIRISPSAHWVALLAAVLTWPLLLVGGSVTVYKVGMAVPDWPTTFGVNMFLYDFLNSSWGVRLEHSHRLYGAAVGVACIILAAWLAVARTPAWVKALGVLALLAVIGQGVLGGYRVRHNSTDLAFLHGCTAQAFFALMVALCVLTGRDWTRPVEPRADAMHLRRRAAVTLGLVYFQIVLGAWVRHYGTLPAVYVHALVATAVWGHAVAVALRVRSRRAELGDLMPSAWAMLVTSTLQVLLGVLSWWLLRPFDGIARTVLPAQAAVRIAHQGVGALLLASAVVLTMRAFRHLKGEPGPMRSPAPKGLETVA
jgi:cytochrome c oxidase assembly protein subunit 15